MNKQELMNILKIGENSEIEFKESKNKLPKSIWETYSSFANSKGGVIILGIKEDSKTKTYTIDGVDNEKNILKDFWNNINNKEKVSKNILDDDNIELKQIDGKNVIIIMVPRASRINKPIYINNNPLTGTYKRYRDGDFKCEEYVVKAMISESSEKSKDQIILEEFDINAVNIDTLRDYRAAFKVHKGEDHPWNRLSDEEFLYMLDVLDRNTKKLKLAGLIMFGSYKDITKVLSGYFLDYREVMGINVNRWSHRITAWDETWTGNLWDFFGKIVNRLTADIEIPFALDEKMMRIDNTEIHECIREALTNTLVHFQLDESGSIVIEKRENYFKFDNPGTMRVPVEEALKGGKSDPRNPLLHKMFSYLGYGERARIRIIKN